MIELFNEMLSNVFMQRAVIVGLLVSICSALLGVILVLKKYAMIGDGLSHVGFGSLAIAAALNLQPLIVAIPTVIIVAFFLLRISESSKIKGDSAIALISTGSLAVGVMVISMTTGMNTDVSNYLFGSILGLSRLDVILTIYLAIIILIMFVLFYHRIFAITFDETFLKATGVKTNFFNVITAILTALIIVLGMRTIGSLLMSSLMIFPALSSMRVFKSFKAVILNSLFISILCFSIGVTLSYVYNLPTGASISVMNIIAFIIYYIIGIFFRI